MATSLKTIEKGVSTIVEVDNGIINLLFPVKRRNTTEYIEYDTATVEGVLPEYNSFRNSANVVQKDGWDVVRVAPANFNESITQEAIDAFERQFGQSEEGNGTIDSKTMSILTQLGKLRLRSEVMKKKITYEALTKFKIEKGFVDKNGNVQDIVFGVPTENRKIVSTTWDDANATPLDDIKNQAKVLKVPPTYCIMNDTTYDYFEGNAQVLTANKDDGTRRNFVPNEKVVSGKDLYLAGKIIYRGLILDVYVEKGTYEDKNGVTQKFLPDGEVILASPKGEFHYGGIPKIANDKPVVLAKEFDVSKVLQQDPPMLKYIYKSAPLPVLKNGNAFGSLQVL